MESYRVRCAWDEEAKVWYVEDSNVPGLAAEAGTFESLVAVLETRVPELLDENDIDDQVDIPLEITSLSRHLVHRRAA